MNVCITIGSATVESVPGAPTSSTAHITTRSGTLKAAAVLEEDDTASDHQNTPNRTYTIFPMCPVVTLLACPSMLSMVLQFILGKLYIKPRFVLGKRKLIS